MTGGRAVVVTGGAGGMGFAAAEALAGAGTLVLVDLQEDVLDQRRRSLEDAGAHVRVVPCDVTASGDVATLADAVADLGGLRSLVHTAGVSPKMADGRRVLEVDLVGTIRVLDALLPHAGLGSAAVCVGSIAGYAGLAPELDPLLADPLAPRDTAGSSRATTSTSMVASSPGPSPVNSRSPDRLYPRTRYPS